MSLREWMDNDPERCQHAQFCPECAAAAAPVATEAEARAIRTALQRLDRQEGKRTRIHPRPTTTEEGTT